MVGKSMARRTRSGTLVGPGICRKWRPARREGVEGIELFYFGSMKAPAAPIRFLKTRPETSGRGAALRREVDGQVLFDAASRGRYSTDASIYQVEPLGIVLPRSEEAARAAIAIAAEQGIPLLPRGAGSSQCGQAVGEALVIDHTKYLNRILEVEGSRAL